MGSRTQIRLDESRQQFEKRSRKSGRNRGRRLKFKAFVSEIFLARMCCAKTTEAVTSYALLYRDTAAPSSLYFTRGNSPKEGKLRQFQASTWIAMGKTSS